MKWNIGLMKKLLYSCYHTIDSDEIETPFLHYIGEAKEYAYKDVKLLGKTKTNIIDLLTGSTCNIYHQLANC